MFCVFLAACSQENCIFAIVITNQSDRPMNTEKQQIARIRRMERSLDRALAAVKRLSAALDKWEATQDDIAALNGYYGSSEWRQDFEDDEAGRLPEDLKRGVLSEDGIWNLLIDSKELNERMKALGSMTND